MTLRGVVFDMDGVLFDTEVVFDEAWRQVARRLGIYDIEPAIRDCRGVTQKFIREYFNRNHPTIDYDEFDHLAGELYEQLIINGVPEKPGMRRILHDLREMGIKVALATSGVRGRVLHHLKQAGIENTFDVIITGDMVRHSKPAPDIYLTAAEALGVSPSDCIGVEDSHNGVRSAHAAGMHVAMVIDQMPATPEIRALTWRVFNDLHQLNSEITELLNA